MLFLKRSEINGRKELGNFRLQTQTAYTGDLGNTLVWSHPFETQFFPQSFELWPKGIIRLWKLDSNNSLSVFAFGSFYFPFSPGSPRPRNQKGFREIEVPCWSPVNDNLSTQSDVFNQESMPIMTGAQLPARELLTVRPSGSVFVQVNSVFRNLDQSNARFSERV